MSKTLYDVLIQCGKCRGEVDHYLAFERPEIGMETSSGACHRCCQEEDAVITAVEEDRVYREEEELIEWYNEKTPFDTEAIKSFFEYDDETGKYVPKQEFEVVSLTAWTIPESNYPARDWFTLKEVAKIVGKGEEGVRTDYKRGKFFAFQVKGYVQFSGATVLVHRKAIESVYKETGE